MDNEDLVSGYINSLVNFPIKSKILKSSKLSGGLVNYVYRLIFEDASTCILKYYPEFIAADKSVKMSQKRYFVEKAALELLSSNPHLINGTRIRIPKLLFSDDKSFILLMEDVGENCKTLFEILKLDNVDGKKNELLDFVAKEIYNFSSFLTNQSNISTKTHMDPFENKSANHIINTFVKSLYASQAKTLNIENEIEPYLKEMNAYEDELIKSRGNETFVFGDLWPNSIMVDEEKQIVWIIDWEMSRFETPTRDLEQLMANLWIMKQNSTIFDVNSIERIMQRLQLEFFKDSGKDWRGSCKSCKANFVLWILTLVREAHWKLDNSQEVVLKALEEIKSI